MFFQLLKIQATRMKLCASYTNMKNETPKSEKDDFCNIMQIEENIKVICLFKIKKELFFVHLMVSVFKSEAPLWTCLSFIHSVRQSVTILIFYSFCIILDNKACTESFKIKQIFVLGHHLCNEGGLYEEKKHMFLGFLVPGMRR